MGKFFLLKVAKFYFSWNKHCYVSGSNISSDAEMFEMTTIANLSPDNVILWVHLCVSFITFPIAILMMRRFSANLSFVKSDVEISKTLMIENIALELCKSPKDIKRYFQVIAMTLCFNGIMEFHFVNLNKI